MIINQEIVKNIDLFEIPFSDVTFNIIFYYKYYYCASGHFIGY
jgi:hypothetical protein